MKNRKKRMKRQSRMGWDRKGREKSWREREREREKKKTKEREAQKREVSSERVKQDTTQHTSSVDLHQSASHFDSLSLSLRRTVGQIHVNIPRTKHNHVQREEHKQRTSISKEQALACPPLCM